MGGATRSVDGTSLDTAWIPRFSPTFTWHGGSVLAGEPLPRRLLRHPKRPADLSPRAALSPSILDGLADQLVHSARSSTCNEEIIQWLLPPTSRPIEDDPSSPARRAGSLSHARSRFPPASSFPDDRVHPAHSARAAAPEGEGESAGRRQCRRQRDQLSEAIRELVAMTSGCGTTSAGRCSAAEGTSGASTRRDLGRACLRPVDLIFQPGTRPACSIHLCISGPCASSMVVSLT